MVPPLLVQAMVPPLLVQAMVPPQLVTLLNLVPLFMFMVPLVHRSTIVLYLLLLEPTALDKKTAVKIMVVELEKEIAIATMTADEA